MTMQTRGFGAARVPANTPCIPPRKISAQITPVLGAGRDGKGDAR